VEHRLGQRHSTAYPVEIVQGHGPILQGRLCNVSLHGALLEAEDPALPCRGHVQFELRLPDHGSVQRLEAVIIHRDDQRLGVMLLDTWENEAWSALTKPDAQHAVTHARPANHRRADAA
jgi:hypothetical protein